MAGGLVGLLDDVAALAKLAAASVDDVGAAAGRASMKAAGVVVDDTAVTPNYVKGLAAERELPIIRKIAIGSLRNKLLFILPAALLLSEIAPTVVEIILMCRRWLPLLRGGAQGHPRDQARRSRPRVPAVSIGARTPRPHHLGGDPDRLHPVGGDHGDLAQGGDRRAARLPGGHPRRRRLRHHPGGVRRGRPHREEPGALITAGMPSSWATMARVALQRARVPRPPPPPRNTG